MAMSPWGWYVPMTSPTTLAHLACGRSGRRFWLSIEYRIRRCTGFRPSRTSGSALDMMTDMEYSRNERSISSWISIGSIDPEGGSGTSVSVPPDPEFPVPPAPRLAIVSLYPFDFPAINRASGLGPSSDVEEPHVFGVALDEVATQLDVIAHQDRTHLVGHGRLFHRHLQKRSARRVDGRVAQFIEVHLAKSLQALELLLVVRVFREEGSSGQVVLQVHLLLAHQGRVQRWLSHVDEATFHQRLHLAEEESEQQRSDVRSVHVGVGQNDHLVIPDLLDVELLGQSGADGSDECLDLGVLEHLVDPGALDIQDFSADGKNRLGPGTAGVLGRPAGGVAFHDEQFALSWVARRAIDQLARESSSVERRLPTGQVARRLGGHPSPGRRRRLLHDLVGLAGIFLETLGQLFVR